MITVKKGINLKLVLVKSLALLCSEVLKIFLGYGVTFLSFSSK